MKQPKPASVAVVAVNYQTDSLAVCFVREVTAMTGARALRIVLVDNSERADSTEFFAQVLAENPAVCCIKPPTNLGYFRGAWYGIEQCISAEHHPDWVMVTNVDVSFPDSEFFAKLRDMPPTHETGILAPSIRSGITSHDQNPMMRDRPSRTRMRFHRFVNRNYYLLNLYEILAVVFRLVRSAMKSTFGSRSGEREGSTNQAHLRSTSTQESTPVPIYAAHGACMIFSSKFFALGGTLEVPFFLYGEEIYVAEAARALGLKVVYNPCMRVQHDEHQSTRAHGVFLSRQTAKHLRETTDYLVDAYFN